MKKHVEELLSIARGLESAPTVELFPVVTHRGFREIKKTDYPVFHLYEQELSNPEEQSTDLRSYTGGWTYGIQIRSLITANPPLETGDEFEEQDKLVWKFLKALTDDASWQLIDMRTFTATIGGVTAIVTDFHLQKWESFSYDDAP
jgi:hypothetical protein